MRCSCQEKLAFWDAGHDSTWHRISIKRGWNVSWKLEESRLRTETCERVVTQTRFYWNDDQPHDEKGSAPLLHQKDQRVGSFAENTLRILATALLVFGDQFWKQIWTNRVVSLAPFTQKTQYQKLVNLLFNDLLVPELWNVGHQGSRPIFFWWWERRANGERGYLVFVLLSSSSLHPNYRIIWIISKPMIFGRTRLPYFEQAMQTQDHSWRSLKTSSQTSRNHHREQYGLETSVFIERLQIYL